MNKEVYNMKEDEFNNFIDRCYNELEAKQALLFNEYSIGEFENYWMDQEEEILQFKNRNKVELEFKIEPIGSWSERSNSWMWAWANESIVKPLREKSEAIKELFYKTGYDVFITDGFEGDELMAHELTSMAVNELNALGMYIIPSGKAKLFVALIKVTSK